MSLLLPLNATSLEIPKNVDDFPKMLFEKSGGFVPAVLPNVFTTEGMLFQLHLSRVIVVANGLFS